MRRQISGALAGAALLAVAAVGLAPDAPRAGQPEPDRSARSDTIPDGLAALRETYRRVAEVPYPADNPDSPAKAELGGRLFFDPILSGGGTMSCASCHVPSQSWSDNRPRGIGETGAAMKVRTPTLLDVAQIPILGWDGKFRDLEDVTFTPITSPSAMNLREAEAIARLARVPDYVRAFSEAFAAGPGAADAVPESAGAAVTRRRIQMALATFQRTIVSGRAPFDRWVEGDETAIGSSAKAGFAVFNGKGRCAACHSGWTFTDGSFHDIGVGTGEDIGRAAFFRNSVQLRYAFKTPTLRDVAERGPYMHDGSLATLAEVIDLYDRGGIERPSRSPAIAPIGLTEAEKRDLLAFLRTLSAEVPGGPRLN
jgi:cytochrome c peroxidase